LSFLTIPLAFIRLPARLFGCFSCIFVSLTEFRDGFFDGYLEITMECVICDVPLVIILILQYLKIKFAAGSQNWILYVRKWILV